MNLRDEYQRGLAAYGDESERARMAALQKHPAPNPPELLRPVPVRCMRAFFIGGRRVEVGEVVQVEAALARDLEAVKKAVRVQSSGAAVLAQKR